MFSWILRHAAPPPPAPGRSEHPPASYLCTTSFDMTFMATALESLGDFRAWASLVATRSQERELIAFEDRRHSAWVSSALGLAEIFGDQLARLSV